jgi:hypothetical protein
MVEKRAFIFLILMVFLAGCVNKPEAVNSTVKTEIAHDPNISTALPSEPIPLNEDSFYYYVDNERIPLSPSLQWISVKFVSEDPKIQLSILQNFSEYVNLSEKVRDVTNANLTLLPLKSGLDLSMILEGINKLRSDQTNIVFATPVFQIEKDEMLITDEFIATFSTEKTREEIDAINLKNQVEMVEPILGQENTFILRLTNPSQKDLLSMANYYQESGLAVHAAPNFLRLLNKIGG